MILKKDIYSWLEHGVILMLSFVIVSGISCSKSPVLDCFTSTGKITSVERDVADFNSVLLKDNVNLYLRQSDKNKLVLEAGSNLLKKITTEVNADGTLEIKNDNQCNWVRSYDKPLNVYLDFVSLDSLEYRSIGAVECLDTLRFSNFLVHVYEGSGIINLLVKIDQFQANLHYGTADLIVNGEISASYYYQAGAGRIDAINASSKDVFVRNWGSNDMYIWANSLVSAEIKGLGNIYYKGNPQTQVEGEGKGQLLPY